MLHDFPLSPEVLKNNSIIVVQYTFIVLSVSQYTILTFT